MNKYIALILFSLTALLPSSLKAENNYYNYKEMHDFKRLPVLHEGRVKPLDSAARSYARIITGSESPNGYHAIGWLAQLMFNPAQMAEKPLILIKGAELRAQFGIDENKLENSRISLADLLPKLAQTAPRLKALLASDQNELTAQQRNFITIHENAATLTGLMRSLSLLLPLDVEIPQEYQAQIKGKVLNYAELAALETRLGERLEGIVRLKGEDLNAYSDEEKKIALLAFQLQSVRTAASSSSGLLAIIPTNWGELSGGNWYAPWDLVLQGHGSPKSVTYMDQWHNLAMAYRSGESSYWENTVNKTAQVIAGQNLYSESRFTLELYYNSMKPYGWARGLYLITIVLIGVALLNSGYAFLRPAALITGTLAIAAHSAGIVSRVIILDRPPVGTLYESVLFVALICGVAGLTAALWRRADLSYLAGIMAALGLLSLAPVIVPKGETLEVLVAVLNTNFWLATHVTVITAGYGISVLAAALAHFYLIGRITRPRGDDLLVGLYKGVYKTSIVALLLTAVGTVLGGIWADQSWGRFWGWDPKENGALLIVLWLIWLQHGRMAGNLRELGFIAGMGYLNVIVGIAWFGVNLLGVGLHSYGFTSGLALGLGLFCAAETLFIGGLWIYIRIREKRSTIHAA